jgi:hypothetical protein
MSDLTFSSAQWIELNGAALLHNLGVFGSIRY